MGKTLVINMKDIVIEGDILDVAGDITGIIYNISKEIDDEISVDYVDGENKNLLKHRKYGACTFFLNLNKVWGSRKKERIIKEISQYLNKDGDIYNPLLTCSFEEVKKILEKYCKIEETKVWEDIFFIKAKKIID